MEYNYPTHQPEVRELRYLKFKHQIKCEGVCGGKTFTAPNGNQRYCPDCREKLNIPKWDTEKGTTISRQTRLIKEDEKEQKEKLLRLDQDG